MQDPLSGFAKLLQDRGVVASPLFSFEVHCTWMVGSFESELRGGYRSSRGDVASPLLISLQCYERVIRDEKQLDLIRRFIYANPQNWEQDEENPARILGEGEQGDFIV